MWHLQAAKHFAEAHQSPDRSGITSRKRAHEVRSDEDGDHDAHRGERSQRRRHGENHSTQHRAHDNAEHDSEHGIRHGHDPLDVERPGAEPGTAEGNLRKAPPRHDGGDRCAPSGGDEDRPQQIAVQPAASCDALGPREAVRPFLELLGKKRCTPEQAKKKWNGDGEVVDRLNEMVLALRQQQQRGRQRDQAPARDEQLNPVEAPDQKSHCGSPSSTSCTNCRRSTVFHVGEDDVF